MTSLHDDEEKRVENELGEGENLFEPLYVDVDEDSQVITPPNEKTWTKHSKLGAGIFVLGCSLLYLFSGEPLPEYYSIASRLNRHSLDTLYPQEHALEISQVKTFHGPTYSKEHLEWMKKHTECTNIEQVLDSVDFQDPSKDPYPTTFGYDTTIDVGSDCYVVFENEESRLNTTTKARYRLENGRQEDMALRNVTTLGIGTVFRTHAHACGACSTLSALSIYLGTIDLTNPVRSCGMRMMSSRAIKCLQDDVGLEGACGMIWFWNTKNTKRTRGSTGCLGTCLARYFTDNNVFSGSVNPCSPDKCLNTINGSPACSNFQWQEGPYRLNACLQCDECKSGPIFQKVAGRTRRASGIQSAIVRPPGHVREIYHFYGRL